MSSTLDACFKSAEAAATVRDYPSPIAVHPLTCLLFVKNELETRAKELTAEESEIADQRDRLEAERAIDFFDELGSDVVSARLLIIIAMLRFSYPFLLIQFAKDAPAIMQLFHSHGESCTKIENEALQLANHPDPTDENPLKPYNDMLHDLGVF